MRKDIEAEWKKYKECAKCKKSKTRSPPVIPTDLMTFEVGELLSVDLFEQNKSHFILAVDKVSQFMLIRQIQN